MYAVREIKRVIKLRRHNQLGRKGPASLKLGSANGVRVLIGPVLN